ncbi:MAG: hypothetical protein HKO53_16615 [Gemmatimonadetes bacterium]|nr:hypothetical protein [Gemmatimonadota bacterium]
MILPTLRSSLSRRDAQQLVDLLGRHDESLREGAQARLDEAGIDALLDDPRLPASLLSDPEIAVRPEVVFYVLVRHALLEGGVEEVAVADYVASMVVAFGQGGRAYTVRNGGEVNYRYLVDLVRDLNEAAPREAFLIRTHMGNYALWLTGLFPDFLQARVRRRGAPPIEYYENMGRAGYLDASMSPEASALGMERHLRSVSDQFSGVRVALNRVSDRYLWRSGGNPVNRLLREVSALAP